MSLSNAARLPGACILALERLNELPAIFDVGILIVLTADRYEMKHFRFLDREGV